MMGTSSGTTAKRFRTWVRDSIGDVECGFGVQERFGFMKELLPSYR